MDSFPAEQWYSPSQQVSWWSHWGLRSSQVSSYWESLGVLRLTTDHAYTWVPLAQRDCEYKIQMGEYGAPQCAF